MLRVATFVLMTGLPLAALASNDCEFTAERTLDFDAKGLAQFKLDTGAGDLVVEGVPGLARVEVRGKACASEEKALASIQLFQQREGDVATVGTKIPDEGFTWSLFSSHYAYMDVRVRTPSGLKLDLRDSSGDVDISGLTAGLTVKDSSGDLALHDLVGGVRVTDTSGDITARAISGDFTVVSDSSGDIRVEDVKGSAIVEEDSSGDVTLRKITGDARVDRDSSGDIEFSEIGRDAVVGADGSGEVVADNVRGNFTVGAKSGNGGEIRQHNVTGEVTLPPEG